MPFHPTDIPGLLVVDPVVFADERGYFYEAYNERTYNAAGINNHFVQDNESQSSYGVIRGLHYQLHPHAQAKLIRVLEGEILDVAVDLRKGSDTYGKVFSVELSNANKRQLFIPAGFAHGFSVLSPVARVSYKCDAYYHRESEAGIRFDDPELHIDWRIQPGDEIVSGKDLKLPFLKEANHNFVM